MSTVRTPSLLGRLVDLDMLDDQIAGIQTLSIRVRLSVLEQAEKELGALDGPAGFGDTELFACDSPTISIIPCMHPRTEASTAP